MIDFFRRFGLWRGNRPANEGLEMLVRKASEEVRRLAELGKRTRAVQLYRQQTGASLHQALRVINELGQFNAR